MDRLRPAPPVPPAPRLSVPRLRRAGPALCPVTALAFFHHTSAAAPSSALYVLAAEDNHLAVYPAATFTASASSSGSGPACCGRVRIFAEQAIHGCFAGDDDETATGDHVLVWGGQSVALVSRARLARVIEGKDVDDDADDDDDVLAAAAPDWILDGRLLPGGSGSGALVTAHNAVVAFSVRNGTLRLAPPAAHIAPSRPMLLYSARLAWVGADEAGAGATATAEASGFDDNEARLLVAAGTVFGEIVVWTCRLSLDGNPGQDPQIRLRNVFAGHEGSIFGVALSAPVLLRGDGDDSDEDTTGPVRVRLLASCSDDRTVRIWPLPIGASSAPTAAEAEATASFAHAARETGFHNELTDASVPAPAATASSTAALAVAMGHTSRIWSVRFGPRAAETGTDLMLFSFGEDATAQTWRCAVRLADRESDGPAVTAALVPLRTIAGHAGKSIWSAAVALVDSDGTGRTMVATGGCDGRIGVFLDDGGGDGDGDGSDALGKQPCQVVASTVPTDDVEDIVGAQTHVLPRSSRAHDTFVSFAFLAPDRLLATTSRGRLLVGRLDGAALHWTAVPGMAAETAVALQGYSIVRSPCGGGGGSGGGGGGGQATTDLAAIGSGDGRLFVYVNGRIEALTTRLSGGKKVDEVYFLRASTVSSDPDVVVLSVLVAGLFHDEALLLEVEVDTTAVSVSETTAAPLIRGEHAQRLLLPRSTTGQPLTVTAASRCGDALVVGFKTGRLCLFDRTTMAPVSDRPRAARDAVLAIVPLPAMATDTDAFVVTARDGTYRIYTVETPDRVLCLRHETAPPFGPIVRDAWFLPTTGTDADTDADLVLCGFRSTQFVVWNETRQQMLAAVDCGGTHRAHTYCYGPGGQLRFAFTRSGQLAVFAAQDLSAGSRTNTSATLKPGGHGREIRAVCASPGGAYLATGGEDTVVRIWGRWHADGDGPPPLCLAVLKRHNTGLHALAWLGDDCLVSAAGAQELYVWRLARLDGGGGAAAGRAVYRGLAVRCEAAFPSDMDAHAHANNAKPDRKAAAAASKILRITALDATLEPGGTALVSVALSNSLLKTYRYTPPGDDDATNTKAVWTLLAQGRYTGACPTALHHLPTHGDGLAVLAAFADGHLTVWRARACGSDKYALVAATPAHRNAIKSVAVHRVATTTTSVVVTGGDDNALAVTGLTWPPRSDDDNTPLFHKTYRVARAHAASVTGVQVLKASDDDRMLTVVSCSNDQRLKAWRILVRDDGDGNGDGDGEDASVRVQLLDDQYSGIADPGALDAVPGEAVVVVGMGMETWRLRGI